MKIKAFISALTFTLLFSVSLLANDKKYSKLRTTVVEKVQTIKTDVTNYVATKVHIHFTVNKNGELIVKEVQCRNKKLSQAILKGLDKLPLNNQETFQEDFWLTINYKVM